MIDIAREHFEEIKVLKERGLKNSQIAPIMRVRGCEISSGSVAKVLEENGSICPNKTNDLSEATVEELLEMLTDIIDSGRSRQPGTITQMAKILKRTLEIIGEVKHGNFQ